MLSAIILSLLFLLSYICHHLLSGDTKYGDLDHNGIVSAAGAIAYRKHQVCLLFYTVNTYTPCGNHSPFYFIYCIQGINSRLWTAYEACKNYMADLVVCSDNRCGGVLDDQALLQLISPLQTQLFCRIPIQFFKINNSIFYYFYFFFH